MLHLSQQLELSDGYPGYNKCYYMLACAKWGYDRSEGPVDVSLPPSSNIANQAINLHAN